MSNKKSKTISSISATTDSRFIPHNIPSGSIRGDRLNALPINFEVYAIQPNDKSRVRRVTATLNPYTRNVLVRKGTRAEWDGSILNQPVQEIAAKDWVFYHPKDNNRVKEFLETKQPTARGKKKHNTRKNNTKKNKTRKYHTRKYHTRKYHTRKYHHKIK